MYNSLYKKHKIFIANLYCSLLHIIINKNKILSKIISLSITFLISYHKLLIVILIRLFGKWY